MFPVDGVYRTYRKIRAVYDRLGVGDELVLNIVGGGHQDIPDIQVPAQRWFNHYLLGTDSLMDWRMEKECTPEALRVLDHEPEDQINTRVDELFTRKAKPIPEQIQAIGWENCQRQWMEDLESKTFASWPANWPPTLTNIDSLQFGKVSIVLKSLRTDPYTTLPFWVITNRNQSNGKLKVCVLDDLTWSRVKDVLHSSLIRSDVYFEDAMFPKDMEEAEQVIFLPMRGAGPASFSGKETAKVHLKRRFYLLGTSLEAMQTWDLVQGLKQIRIMYPAFRTIYAEDKTAVQLTYATLFEDDFQLHLNQPTTSHNSGPDLPNVLQFMDVPAAVMMSSMKNHVILKADDPALWNSYSLFTNQLGGALTIE